MFIANLSYYDGPWLILGFCRNLEYIHVFPERLGLNKIDSVSGFVCAVFRLVKLELHIGVKIYTW